MLKLIIEDDEGRKTVVPFVRDEITIGRQEGNTIRLTERNVSRHHARLLRQNGHVLVEDLGSYNGVRINGERIQGQAQVGDGDLIQIGDYDLALQKEAAAQVGAPTIRMPAAALQAAMDDTSSASEQEAEAEEADTPAPQEEDDAPTPSQADPRRHSTAVIRMDQVEMNRSRKVTALEPEEAPHLVVVSAEFKGQEFACIRTEMRIGRTDDNDIALDHRSLSRTHAKIVREDSGEWRIIDMQSANGMAVNGESYAQAPLAHGDLIELGHVKMRFVGPGQSTAGLLHEGAAKSGSAKKPLMLAVVAVVLLGVLGGAAWFLMGQSSTPPKPPPTTVVDKQPEPPQQTQPANNPEQAQNPTPTPTPQPPPEPAIPQLEEKMQSARAAIQALDYDQAVDTLETIKDANGQRPAEVEELLTQARAEQGFRQNLDLAQKELAADRPQEAQKYLEASAGTLAFADEYAELKQQVEEALAPPAKPTPAPNKSTSGTARRPGADAKQLYDDGVTLLRKTQLPEAESVLKKCIAVDPTYANCYLVLGTTVARRNRPDEGAQYYREFLRLAPNHEMAPSVKKLVADYDKSQKQPGGGK